MTGTDQPREAMAGAIAKKLKPYPRMKDSSIEWLGEVPVHWEVLPNRAVFVEINERGHSQEQMLAVTISRGVIPQQTLLEDSSKKDASRLDKSAYKLVLPGDIAYNKMRAWQGALGVSDYRGIISPAYVVQRPRQNADARFLHYLLRTPRFTTEAERWSYGITSDMWSLRPEHFRLIYTALPPFPEQTAIVRYLDYVDRRVRRLTWAKRKLVALLKEQKQAIIHRAVTRGLDPNAPMKDSGVEWLGEVPSHWEVKPLRSLARSGKKSFVDGDWIESPYITDEGIRLIQTGNIGVGFYKEQGFRYVSSETFQEFNCTEVVPGDILICRLADPVGRACLAPNLVSRMITSVDVCILKPRADLVSSFVIYLLSSVHYLGFMESQCRGSTRNRVSRSFLGSVRVSLPPFPEQTAIVEYLDKATADIDAAIDRANREVELLDEYRTRLIADVVTGKLDVREAAAALPEVDPLSAEAETDEAGLDETLTEADNIDASRETAAM